MENQKSIYERISENIRKSVTLKLVTITTLMLLLLIPTSMVDSIISERQYLRGEAIEEVSNIWAKEQKITGPILSIPCTYEVKGENETMNYYTRHWNILPENLSIEGDISPKELKRGLYKIVVYNSELMLNGKFKIPKAPNAESLVKINYEDAFLTLGITDLRGIEEEIEIQFDKKKLNVIPGTRISDIVYSGITSDIGTITDSSTNNIDFNISLSLQGSHNMTFVPVGNTSEVKLSSNWPSPSFNGNFLPDNREVSESGFNAYWKILQLNRNIPQSWIGSIDSEKFNSANFGLDLIQEVDDYQKATRSAKYAVMTIALSFLIFFLVEILNGRKIHPFQYTLVGLSLCMFYVLLISISEHSNFNIAYIISTIVIVSMISLYSLKVFKSPKLTVILSASLMGTYGFLYTTLQISDYALLMGSVGLTIILGATMYFTRNINWYQLSKEQD